MLHPFIRKMFELEWWATTSTSLSECVTVPSVKNTRYKLKKYPVQIVPSVTLRTRHSVYVPSGQFPFTLGESLTLGMLYIVPSVFKTLGTKEHLVQKLRHCTDLTVTDNCIECHHSVKKHSVQWAQTLRTKKNHQYIISTFTSVQLWHSVEKNTRRVLHRVFALTTSTKNTRYNNSNIIQTFKCIFYYPEFT
jgi:hypothetical protein